MKCEKCGKIRKDQTTRMIASVKRTLESALAQGKRKYQISGNEREMINRVAKLQEAYGILEHAISKAVSKL